MKKEADIDKNDYGVRSIRLEKENKGKATGFWKGITSTEAQEFTYTVGITSTDSNSTSKSSAEKLNSSLESGWNASVTAGAKAGFMGSGVSVEGTLGKSGTETKDKERSN